VRLGQGARLLHVSGCENIDVIAPPDPFAQHTRRTKYRRSHAAFGGGKGLHHVGERGRQAARRIDMQRLRLNGLKWQNNG
jgi:hypothetical protein